MPKITQDRRSRVDQSVTTRPFDPNTLFNAQEHTLPLLQQLDSDLGKERKKACNMLSLAIFNPTACSLIIENNGVQKLIHRVGDSVYPVVAYALAALRNLLITRHPKVISLLAKPSNLELILIPYTKCQEHLKQNVEKETATKIIYHALGIFWNLAIEEESVVEFILQKGLLNNFASFLDINQFPVDLAISSAHLIAALTDESPKTISFVQQQPKLVELLFQLSQVKIGTSGCAPLIPILCSAILWNIRDQKNQESAKKILHLALVTIDNTINQLSPNEEIMSQIERITQTEEAICKETIFVKEIELTKNGVEAQVAALELFANICCAEDWEDEEAMGEERTFPQQLSQFCASFSVPKLLAMCQSSSSEIIVQLETYPAAFSEMIDFLADRNARLFAALSNLLSVVSPSTLSSILSPGAFWNELGRLFDILSVNRDELKLLEGTVSTMRAFITSCEDVSFLQEKDLEGMFKLTQNVFSSEIRRCGITMLVSVIGRQDVAQHQELYQKLGTVLLGKLNDESISVVSESLNGIFDIFGEDETSRAAQAIQLVSALQQFVPLFISRVQTQGSTFDEETRLIVEECLENTTNFISYKLTQ